MPQSRSSGSMGKAGAASKAAKTASTNLAGNTANANSADRTVKAVTGSRGKTASAATGSPDKRDKGVARASGKPAHHTFKVAAGAAHGYHVLPQSSSGLVRSKASHELAAQREAGGNRSLRLHVVPEGDRWAIKPEGAKIGKVYPTQAAALKAATAAAKSIKSGVVVHGRSGRIRQSLSYDS